MASTSKPLVFRATPVSPPKAQYRQIQQSTKRIRTSNKEWTREMIIRARKQWCLWKSDDCTCYWHFGRRRIVRMISGIFCRPFLYLSCVTFVFRGFVLRPVLFLFGLSI